MDIYPGLFLFREIYKEYYDRIIKEEIVMLNEKLVKMLVEGELKGIENDVLRQQVINLEKQVKLLKPFAYVGSFVVGYYGTVLVFKTIEHATKRK